MWLSNRRFFLKSGLGALGILASRERAGAARSSVPPTASRTKLRIIDTHTHFYDPGRPESVPWPPRNDQLLYRKMAPADYREAARPFPVAGTVVIEASPWLEDNQWLLDLAAKEPFIVGVVGNLSPGTESFTRHLDRFGANPLFRGIRIGGARLARGLDEDAFLQDLGRLAERDLALDLLASPTMLEHAARLARQIPSLRLIIDHVANVRIDGEAPPGAWLAGIRAVAKHPNAFCKVSGLVEGTGKRDGHAPGETGFYRPVLHAVWDLFGEDRLLYGSNWPVCTRFADLATVQGIVADYFGANGRDVADKFFWRNSRKAYKWVVR